MATRLTQQQRSGLRPRQTNRHRRQTATLCDTTTRISRAYTTTTRHHRHNRRLTSQHFCCLRRTLGAQWQRGMHSHTQQDHRGRARSPQPDELSWHADFAREKWPGCAAVRTTVPGTATPAWTRTMPCNMQQGGGGIGLRQRACTCNLSPAAAPPPVGLSRYPPSAISAELWHASAFLVWHLLSMAT